jgi:aspartate-semialdehyde dehydrogenase
MRRPPRPAAEPIRRVRTWVSRSRSSGATGNVGREMLNILEERGFPADEVVALASRRSVGTEVSYGDKHAQGEGPRNLRFLRHRYLPDVGRRQRVEGMVAEDRQQGCVVIDNSSAWRYDQDVPLIVPEVNPDAVAGFTQEEHHRQSELLDRAARRRAEAAA